MMTRAGISSAEFWEIIAEVAETRPKDFMCQAVELLLKNVHLPPERKLTLPLDGTFTGFRFIEPWVVGLLTSDNNPLIVGICMRGIVIYTTEEPERAFVGDCIIKLIDGAHYKAIITNPRPVSVGEILSCFVSVDLIVDCFFRELARCTVRTQDSPVMVCKLKSRPDVYEPFGLDFEIYGKIDKKLLKNGEVLIPFPVHEMAARRVSGMSFGGRHECFDMIYRLDPEVILDCVRIVNFLGVKYDYER